MLIPYDIAPIVKAAATEETRYAIHGVQFSRLPDDQAGQRRCRAEATNGRILARIDWMEADTMKFPGLDALCLEPVAGFKATLPADRVAKMAKSLSKPPAAMLRAKPILGNYLLEEPTTNGKAKVQGRDQENEPQNATIQTLENRFPDTDAVIPKKSAAKASVKLNPTYLKTLCEIAEKALGCGEDSFIELSLTDDAHPVLLTAEAEGRTLTACIMPISE